MDVKTVLAVARDINSGQKGDHKHESVCILMGLVLAFIAVFVFFT